MFPKKTIWRPIYEVIHASFFEKIYISPPEFLDKCKNNTNGPQFLPSEVKLVLKIMAMEQGLYVQVVMIRRKDSDNKK